MNDNTPEPPVQDTSIHAKMENLRNKILSNGKEFREDILVALFFTCVPIIVAIRWYPFTNNLILKIVIYLALSVSILIGIAFFSLAADNTSGREKKELRNLLQERDLLESKDADIRFQMHQAELKQYYDINIAQIKTVNSLGIILLFLGIAIIFATLILFAKDIITQLTPMIVGCACGMLIDFIGAFFVVMYTQTMNAAISFHEKLAASNNLLLSHAIAMKIKDETIKDQALLEISKNIAISPK